MLTVYGLVCNGLRDPRGVSDPVVLSWRTGSDRAGAHMASCHVVVTSITTGETMWDDGWVPSARGNVVYAGLPLQEGHTYVWFVEVADDAGELAQGVPAAFVFGGPSSEAASERGPECVGILWAEGHIEAEETSGLQRLNKAWHDVLGLSWDADRRHVLLTPPLCKASARRLRARKAKGSLLLPQGLLVADVERKGDDVRAEVVLPPGVNGVLKLAGRRYELDAGRHVLEVRVQAHERSACGA